MDHFYGIRGKVDSNPSARAEYERRVASKDLVLDVGGRNAASKSNRKLRSLSSNPKTTIVSTDIVDLYEPDLVDDICNSEIESNSFDGLYVDAILEHVQDYWLAMENIHRILKPGGEAFIYVPFFWQMHDRMDFHRFTVTELDRMLERFSEHKIFLADENGYGGVVWQLLTCYLIDRTPKLLRFLAKLTNVGVTPVIALRYLLATRGDGSRAITFRDYRFLYTHVYISHGFCGWAKK